MCRQSQRVMSKRPKSSHVLWEATVFLGMAVPHQARGRLGSSASLATAKVNSWRKMQKYILALGIARLPAIRGSGAS